MSTAALRRASAAASSSSSAATSANISREQHKRLRSQSTYAPATSSTALTMTTTATATATTTTTAASNAIINGLRKMHFLRRKSNDNSRIRQPLMEEAAMSLTADGSRENVRIVAANEALTTTAVVAATAATASQPMPMTTIVEHANERATNSTNCNNTQTIATSNNSIKNGIGNMRQHQQQQQQQQTGVVIVTTHNDSLDGNHIADEAL